VNSPGAYIYVLYGEDTFSRDEALLGLKERMRQLPAGEHNLTELAGGDATVAALRLAADVVPFLAERRMVVVEGLLGRLQGRGGQRRSSSRSRRSTKSVAPAPDELEMLLAYLPDVPLETSIVFVDGVVDVAAVEEALPHGRGLIREFPRVRDVAGWLRNRARGQDLDIDEGGIRLLASLGGDDLRRLDNELQKLAAASNGARVTRADVQELVIGRDIAIWALLDAIAERRQARALEALRTLYTQGEPPEALLGRDIAPLVRRLVVAKELALLPKQERARVDPAAIGLNPRVVDRLLDQVAGFDRQELQRAMEVLLELDRKIKIGETEPEPALELAVAALCS
jgi:DNA polymerase-3 subunit delta